MERFGVDRLSFSGDTFRFVAGNSSVNTSVGSSC